MKRLLKIIRNNPSLNSGIRQIIKSFSLASSRVSKKLMIYWPVAGKVRISTTQYEIFLMSKGNDALTSKLYYGQKWENEVVELFKLLIQKSKVFYDIGGHIGLFSLIAENINPNVKINCFEPNPKNVARIKENVKINNSKHIELTEKAIGSELGNLIFYKPKGDYISDVSSFYNAHTNSFNDFGTEEVEVEVTTLDSFIAEGNPIPNLIKIDVELYEYQALKGALKLLTEYNPVIIIELFNDEVKRTLNPALDKELEKGLTIKIEKLLFDLGYYSYLISGSGLLFVENLRSNPDSSMYLLSKTKLSKTFYLTSNFKEAVSELLNRLT
ncbi:MAG: FkbM family methyltransferase [Psychroserpens sp.]